MGSRSLLTLFLICVSYLCWSADASCHVDKSIGKFKIDKVGGEMHLTFYCSYRGKKWSYGIMEFDDVCEKCNCKFFYPSCCTLGSGVTTEYEGCTRVTHGCQARYYRMVNGQKMDCFSDLPFDENFWLK
uniref:Uncharacterized protein n=1 Tax=Magallana gigas TaxID=29159 RepID=A0A8W8L9H5_MAGGI|nr:uncharacterized protein LOC105341657 [Crassostrea gigas]